MLRLVLARLLAPDAFGLVAMAVVLTGLCSQLADLGLGPALVQRSDLTDRHKSTAFWASLGLGASLAGLFAWGAPLAGLLYSDPAVVPVVRALGLSLLLSAPESVYRYLFEREMSFKVVGLRRIAGILVGGAVGITLALRGAGAWALVAENIVRTATGSALLMASSRWRPSFVFSRTALAELWSFSRSIVGTRIVNFFNRNLDNLLIGRVLGASALGFYSVAYQGVLFPLQQVARPIANVSFPAFASIQDDLERCRAAYLGALRMSLLLSTPLPLGALLVSPLAIPLVLGEQWAPAAPPFQILSGVALVQASMSLSPPMFNALGRADLSFRWTLVALSANAIGIVIGLQWGIVGVSIGYLAAVATTAPIQFTMLRWLIRLRLPALLGVLGPMVVADVLSAAAPWLILRQESIAPWPRLLLATATLIVGYLLFTWWLAPQAWALIRRSARSVA